DCVDEAKNLIQDFGVVGLLLEPLVHRFQILAGLGEKLAQQIVHATSTSNATVAGRNDPSLAPNRLAGAFASLLRKRLILVAARRGRRHSRTSPERSGDREPGIHKPPVCGYGFRARRSASLHGTPE